MRSPLSTCPTATMEDGPHFDILERNWRRVASTHTFQDLLNADKPANHQESFNWKYFLLGCTFILLGVAILSVGVFVIVVLPWINISTIDTDNYNYNAVVVALKNDRYYHLLIPLTIPVTIIMVTLNWFSMKLFKHNS